MKSDYSARSVHDCSLPFTGIQISSSPATRQMVGEYGSYITVFVFEAWVMIEAFMCALKAVFLFYSSVVWMGDWGNIGQCSCCQLASEEAVNSLTHQQLDATYISHKKETRKAKDLLLVMVLCYLKKVLPLWKVWQFALSAFNDQISHVLRVRNSHCQNILQIIAYVTVTCEHAYISEW